MNLYKDKRAIRKLISNALEQTKFKIKQSSLKAVKRRTTLTGRSSSSFKTPKPKTKITTEETRRRRSTFNDNLILANQSMFAKSSAKYELENIPENRARGRIKR